MRLELRSGGHVGVAHLEGGRVRLSGAARSLRDLTLPVGDRLLTMRDGAPWLRAVADHVGGGYVAATLIGDDNPSPPPPLSLPPTSGHPPLGDRTPLATRSGRAGMDMEDRSDGRFHADALRGDDRDFWRRARVALDTPALEKAATLPRKPVQKPGSRGGVYWYDERGELRYGERPQGRRTLAERMRSSLREGDRFDDGESAYEVAGRAVADDVPVRRIDRHDGLPLDGGAVDRLPKGALRAGLAAGGLAALPPRDAIVRVGENDGPGSVEELAARMARDPRPGDRFRYDGEVFAIVSGVAEGDIEAKAVEGRRYRTIAWRNWVRLIASGGIEPEGEDRAVADRRRDEVAALMAEARRIQDAQAGRQREESRVKEEPRRGDVVRVVGIDRNEGDVHYGQRLRVAAVVRDAISLEDVATGERIVGQVRDRWKRWFDARLVRPILPDHPESSDDPALRQERMLHHPQPGDRVRAADPITFVTPEGPDEGHHYEVVAAPDDRVTLRDLSAPHRGDVTLRRSQFARALREARAIAVAPGAPVPDLTHRDADSQEVDRDAEMRAQIVAGGLGDLVDVDDLRAAWAGGYPGGWHAEIGIVEARSEEAGGGIQVYGEIYNRNRHAGDFQRIVARDHEGRPVVIHESIELHSKLGQGFGYRFNERAEARYREWGVDRVELYADISVGKYAWARQGYDFAAPVERDRVVERFAAWLAKHGGTSAADDAALREMAERGHAWDVAAYDNGKLYRVEDSRGHAEGSFPAGKAFLLADEDAHWLGHKLLDPESDCQKVAAAYRAERESRGRLRLLKSGGRDVQRPGSRGGKGYWHEGRWHYGARPVPGGVGDDLLRRADAPRFGEHFVGRDGQRRRITSVRGDGPKAIVEHRQVLAHGDLGAAEYTAGSTYAAFMREAVFRPAPPSGPPRTAAEMRAAPRVGDGFWIDGMFVRVTAVGPDRVDAAGQQGHVSRNTMLDWHWLFDFARDPASFTPVPSEEMSPPASEGERLDAAIAGVLGVPIGESDLREAYAGRIGHFDAEVTDVRVREGAAVEVRGRILHRGRKESVGHFERALRRPGGELVADHNSLWLTPALRGLNFAIPFNERADEHYRRWGVSRVRLVANSELGVYAWARQGFDFANEQVARQVGKLFAAWCDKHAVDLTPDDRAAILAGRWHAWDIAAYDDDSRHRVANAAYGIDGDFHAGKAFLLSDPENHSWQGTRPLDETSVNRRIWRSYKEDRAAKQPTKPTRKAA